MYDPERLEEILIENLKKLEDAEMSVYHMSNNGEALEGSEGKIYLNVDGESDLDNSYVLSVYNNQLKTRALLKVFNEYSGGDMADIEEEIRVTSEGWGQFIKQELDFARLARKFFDTHPDVLGNDTPS